MTKLATYIFESDMKIYNRIFYTNLYTKYIKNILETLLKTNNDMILKIYWNEFKSIRKTFKTSYDDIVSKTMLNDVNIKKSVKELFDKENIEFRESESVFDNIELYVESNRNKECIQCKICYTNSVNCVLEHENQGCSICNDCSDKLPLLKKCPFCKLPIIGKKKLFIR